MEFEFASEEGSIVVSSAFDSGNCCRAEKVGDYAFNVWIAKDCAGTEFETTYRTWFHFSVKGIPTGKLATFSVRNLNKQHNLFNNGHRPVVKAVPSSPKWQRVGLTMDYEPGEGCYTLTFRHRVQAAGDTLYFAFCYPQSYEECQANLVALDSRFGNRAVVPSTVRLASVSASPTASPGASPPPLPPSGAHLVSPGVRWRPASADPAAPEVRRSPTSAFAAFKSPGKEVVVPAPAAPPAPAAGAGETSWAASSPPASDELYYARELLTHSLDGRRMDLITISSLEGMQAEREAYLPGLFPDRDDPATQRPNTFSGKRVVFISSRVHPGETPSAHVFDGVLDTLTRLDDPRTQRLLSMFVFKLVPMLNPDGVARGHYRADQRGVNLNRCYVDPNPATEPTVFAAKSVVVDYHMQGILHMYLDLHAHATKRGCFLYGNHLPTLEPQVWNVLYARLVSLHCPFLEFGACNFSEKNMKAKDKRDKGVSKEGSGRVAVYNATNLTHVYTLECNYNTGRATDAKPAAASDHGRASPPRAAATTVPKYTPEHWQEVGQACLLALLELERANPWSRVPRSTFKTLEGALAHTERLVSLEAPYREQKREKGRKPSSRSLGSAGSRQSTRKMSPRSQGAKPARAGAPKRPSARRLTGRRKSEPKEKALPTSEMKLPAAGEAKVVGSAFSGRGAGVRAGKSGLPVVPAAARTPKDTRFGVPSASKDTKRTSLGPLTAQTKPLVSKIPVLREKPKPHPL